MPDFQIKVTAGTTKTAWVDAASPPRINPVPGIQPHYDRVNGGGPTIRISATLNAGGAFEPLDGALGGRLFKWSWVERATAAVVPIVNPVGQTSVANINGGQLTKGHHLVLAWREGGGSMAIPILVPP